MPDIPCPHCGQENEQERDVCWACSNLLKPKDAKPAQEQAPNLLSPTGIPMPPPTPGSAHFSPRIFTRTVNTKITVNGKEYASLEEVPEPFRSSLKNGLAGASQAMRSGKKSRIVVNGQEYETLEDVPEPFRSKLKEGLAEAKPEIVKAAPSGMSTFRVGPFVVKSHGRYLYEPLDMDPSLPLAPPDGFQCDAGGPERRISWRWFTWESMKGIFFAAMFGVPFAFMLYAYLNTPANKPWPSQAMAALLLLGLPPAAITYAWLCYLVNRTTLLVDDARVSVRHGPLPSWGGGNILKADIALVVSEKRTYASSTNSDGTVFEPKVTYQVRLLLKGGKTRNLATGLLAPEQAMFIEQQIRRA